MKKFKVVIGRKNVENLDQSKFNVVPKSFSPYLIDLNPSIAYTNNLNLISGRDKEINRIYTCLLSQNKSKIVLLGDHGVGKSATVQKLMYNVVTLKVWLLFSDWHKIQGSYRNNIHQWTKFWRIMPND